MTAELSALLMSRRAQLEQLAAAWLAAGATSVGLWQADSPLRQWPADASPNGHDLTATIRSGREVVGELRVGGVDGTEAQARVAADAELLSNLVSLEGELETMTAEVIERQDQLLAMYDLTQSMRHCLTIEDTLRTLAHEVVRLIRAEGGFALLVPPDAPLQIEQEADLPVGEDVARRLFEGVRASGREHLVDANDAGVSFPPGVSQVLVLPILIRGEVTAALGLRNRDHSFASPDIKLARAVADQGGAQIETVLLYQETLAQARYKTELDLAADIQQRLLPRAVPRIAGLDIAAGARTALEVGGDLYDFMVYPDRPFSFVVADVSGKGMAAAMLGSITHTIVRNGARFGSPHSPERMLQRANLDLCEDFGEVGRFATAFIGQYDPDSRRLRYANAGHSPVVYREANGSARLLAADVPPIGILPDLDVEERSLACGSGDLLIVATDGFSEASNPRGELFGYDRLLRLVDDLADRSAVQIMQGMFDAVRAFAAGEAQDDDQTVVVIKGAA